MSQPRWIIIYDQLANPVISLALNVLHKLKFGDLNLVAIPVCAATHLSTCLEMSNAANKRGYHSVSACLLRQCVETLTLIDIGLQSEEYARPLLEEWRDGKRGHGELRSNLEKAVWPGYGKGLWSESWGEFFGQLSRAVQPYAHFTNQLMLWEFKTDLQQQNISQTADGVEFIATTRPTAFDSQKAQQIATLEALMVWTLGRLLEANCKLNEVTQIKKQIDEFGLALADSEYINRNYRWNINLLPIMINWK